MMNLLRLIGGRTASAPVARERLQISFGARTWIARPARFAGSAAGRDPCCGIAAYRARSGKDHRQDGQGHARIDA